MEEFGGGLPGRRNGAGKLPAPLLKSTAGE
jgi:hypothetical protein